MSQDSPLSVLEPVTEPKSAKRQRKTMKPPSVQAAIIAKYMNGANKTQISKDLDISRGTVISILSQTDIEHQVNVGRSRIVSLIPRSIDVIDKRISSGSETAALAVLRGTQVLAGQQITVNQTNVHANTWVALQQSKALEAAQIIEATTISSVPTEK